MTKSMSEEEKKAKHQKTYKLLYNKYYYLKQKLDEKKPPRTYADIKKNPEQYKKMLERQRAYYQKRKTRS